MLSNFKSFIEKNISDKDLEKKVNSIKVKIKDSLIHSPKQPRKRSFQLSFSDPVILPPPLPAISANEELFYQPRTEYAINPFSFYHNKDDEDDEPVPVPDLNVLETELPVIPEPQEGLHPLGFDGMTFGSRREQHQVVDVTPRFMSGKSHPMRTYNQTPPQERVISLQELNTSVNVTLLSYVCIADFPMTTKTKKVLWKRLSMCPLLETLILKNIGIGCIGKKGTRFPNLRFCDVSQNRISSFRSIRKVIKYSPNLEVFNLLGNPVCRDDYQLHLVAKLLVLETINQKQMTIDERIRGITLYGTSSEKSVIETTRWRLHLDDLAEVRAMRPVHTGWLPQNIRHLVLQNSMLRYFYVGNMPNLNHLDLSSNMLTDISKAGLEKCNHLFYTNFRGNLLAKPDTINVYELTPSMRFVILDGNRLEGYRLRLIYITRDLKGTNRMCGLVQIDDVAVTKEERIKAIEAFEPANPAAAASYRWRMTLIERFGHKQLQTIPDYLTKVKGIQFARLNLSACDISMFISVQVMDLSGNHLSSLNGLQNLKFVRILHLHDNPELDTSIVLQQLTHTDTLESFTFYVNNTPTVQRSQTSMEYRALILQLLVPKNRNLLLVDNAPITFYERVDAYGRAGFPREVVEKYRFFLALTVNCTRAQNRGIHPDQVEIGKQYDPTLITVMRRLRGWNMVTEAINFSFFPLLTELDLEQNRIVDIAPIGLNNLPHLKRLSLVNNCITSPLPVVGQLLEHLTNLEIFAIRGNPIMQTQQDRLMLIGHVPSMRQIDSTLKVIDTEVTINDKIEGWKLVTNELKEPEEFKLLYITGIKSINLFDDSLVNLELCGCSLEYLDVTPYSSLKTLILPNNKFKSFNNLPGITKLEIFALDLRYNEFASVDDVKAGVLQMPYLQVLGMMGNPFKNTSSYRVKFLFHLLPLYTQHRYPLTILDSSEITCEELLEASTYHLANTDSASRREGLFNICLLRRSSNHDYSTLVELDLHGCNLSVLFLGRLPNLVVLNLADNLISDTNYKESGIIALQNLRALDLRNNKLKELTNICRVIDVLSLESVFIEENPCYDKDSEKDRIRFFKKLTNTRHMTTLKYLNGIEATPADHIGFGKTKSRK
ncbi:hypothetical protein SAMD00019534_047440 [Acytostelium subglobosum LB1]|uniref:hypothetical protein n=1 Tax=Acytostelium subglobosum LB1 TaxID=1410327 RepID=UPI00064493D1|nr:hypothetical protein SAMD00019534_047440 [Acytostelium subglobosum LB1]GAM21569.1 hypothetical protein SAMD00019534_047440 [Acytostelium subglobosum LB1]|eukprot:XP_012755688.1 hypothetical protein SAMD00019534_047440 [Acytostelium subglobosum LB1]